MWALPSEVFPDEIDAQTKADAVVETCWLNKHIFLFPFLSILVINSGWGSHLASSSFWVRLSKSLNSLENENKVRCY